MKNQGLLKSHTTIFLMGVSAFLFSCQSLINQNQRKFDRTSFQEDTNLENPMYDGIPENTVENSPKLVKVDNNSEKPIQTIEVFPAKETADPNLESCNTNTTPKNIERINQIIGEEFFLLNRKHKIRKKIQYLLSLEDSDIISEIAGLHEDLRHEFKSIVVNVQSPQSDSKILMEPRINEVRSALLEMSHSLSSEISIHMVTIENRINDRVLVNKEMNQVLKEPKLPHLNISQVDATTSK